MVLLALRGSDTLTTEDSSQCRRNKKKKQCLYAYGFVCFTRPRYITGGWSQSSKSEEDPRIKAVGYVCFFAAQMYLSLKTGDSIRKYQNTIAFTLMTLFALRGPETFTT